MSKRSREDSVAAVGALLLTACAVNDMADSWLTDAVGALEDTPYMRERSRCRGCIKRAQNASTKSQKAMRWWMGGLGAWDEVVEYSEKRAEQCAHDVKILCYSISDYLLKAREPYAYERAMIATAKVLLETAVRWQEDILAKAKSFGLSQAERIKFAQASKAGAVRWLDEADELWRSTVKATEGIDVIAEDPRCRLAFEVLFRRLTNPDDNAEALRETGKIFNNKETENRNETK